MGTITGTMDRQTTGCEWHEKGRTGYRPARWLPDQDLNLNKQIQSLLCYRYTIGQATRTTLLLCGGKSSGIGP